MKCLGIVVSVAGLLLGCGCSQRLDLYRYDNPAVRLLQAERLERLLPTQQERTSVMKFFAPRVGLIVTGDPGEVSVGSGQAAAISADGYYLTAAHAIGDEPFFLSETTLGKVFKQGIRDLTSEELEKLIQVRNFPGRIVWQDQESDLALVKFDKISPHYFEINPGGISVGSTVYSADDSGFGLVVEDRTGSESVIGNGPFLVAGTVLWIGPSPYASDAVLISSDIIARGGMSGTPLATRDGTLRGIVVHIDVNRRSPEKMRTVATMVSPAYIRELIRADRKYPSRRTPK